MASSEKAILMAFLLAGGAAAQLTPERRRSAMQDAEEMASEILERVNPNPSVPEVPIRRDTRINLDD